MAASPAISNVETPRTLDLTSEMMPTELAPDLRDTDPIEVAQEIPLPSGVKLAVGEAIQVEYADGLVLHEQSTAACKTTSSVTKPKLVTFPKQKGRTSSSHSFGQSSGCSGNLYVNFEQLVGNKAYGRTEHKVSPGKTVSKLTQVTCAKKTSTKWKAANYLDDGYNGFTISETPNVTLACKPA